MEAKVPATSANLGSGFDAVGIALSLYAHIEMAPSEKTTIRLTGPNTAGLPTDKTNLLYKIAQRLFAEAGVELPELDISVRSDIPLTRGLGSSAAAIVGALGAANALIGDPLPRDELFRMATRIEGHPDNVGPAVYGGIVAAVWDGERAAHLRIEPPEALTTLIAVPAYELPTHQAREALPRTYSREDTVFNLSRAALLTAALSNGRLDLLADAMRDRLHQPYRAPLVPGLDKVLREAPLHGALGAALSGAGPTAILFVDKHTDRKEELESFLHAAMGAHGPVELLWLPPSGTGLELAVRSAPGSGGRTGGAQ